MTYLVHSNCRIGKFAQVCYVTFRSCLHFIVQATRNRVACVQPTADHAQLLQAFAAPNSLNERCEKSHKVYSITTISLNRPDCASTIAAMCTSNTIQQLMLCVYYLVLNKCPHNPPHRSKHPHPHKAAVAPPSGPESHGPRSRRHLCSHHG